MNITEYLKKHILYLDGGTGTLLQEAGLAAGERPEIWNITQPDIVKRIHKDYFDAGSNLVSANTFGANILKFSESELEQIISSALGHAKWAAKASKGEQKKWVALDIGPTGRMLKPFGDLDFEEAVEIFAKTVRLGVKYGADSILIETMNDSYETKAALLAAKENSSLPVFVSNAYGEDGKLISGATPAAMVALLEGMGADAIGVNCSLGPGALRGVVKEYLEYSSLPVIVKANAGLPRLEAGKTVYDLSADAFGRDTAELVRLGARIAGGCCGTTPEYIASLVSYTNELEVKEITKKSRTLVSSYARVTEIGALPVLIGERINPTGKPRLKEALKNGDIDHLLREAVGQEDAGAHIMDVNVGLPGINETEMLTYAITEIQAVTSLPLQIDSSDTAAMESALRRYNGKAMINSVNGRAESMATVFPLVKKYGGVAVALTLDEQGIPKRAEDRLEIARRILAEARKYGVDKKDIIFDPLAMAVSADKESARETLRAVKLIKERLGCHTSLGVSNVSFGLPGRDTLNSAFFTMALENGLSAAIMNPYSDEMMSSYHAYLALSGLDDSFERYIGFTSDTKQSEASSEVSDLREAIIRGMKERAAGLTRDLVKKKEPISIINDNIIPALDTVGIGYEKGRIYLPGLLMSAEAASAAFGVIREVMPKAESCGKGRIVIATVKGDIHDIGKNIVKLVLENYGYDVIDLGRDVPPERVVEEAERLRADIVGLSALMTTTLPAMEKTVALIRDRLPKCRVMVGGAVLTAEYAERIGAHAFAKDAMAAVRAADRIQNAESGFFA